MEETYPERGKWREEERIAKGNLKEKRRKSEEEEEEEEALCGEMVCWCSLFFLNGFPKP